MAAETENYYDGTLQELVQQVDENEIVARITVNDETVDLTRKAELSMVTAIDASANQPTIFFRSRFCVLAVCDILDEDILDYSFRAIDGVDWNKVLPGEKETYPTTEPPTKEEFSKVRVVYNNVKSKKDKAAVERGMPKSGVQSYVTFKQKWQLWREFCPIYKAMNPNMSNKTLMDLVTSELKLCTSVNAIWEVVESALKRHLAKLKKSARQQAKARSIDTELVNLVEEEKVTEDVVAKLSAAEAEAKRKVEEAKEQARADARNRNLRNRIINASKEQDKVHQEVKQAEKAKKALETKKKELKKQKATIVAQEPEVSSPARKKSRRSDTTLLNEAVTPRNLASLKGAAFMPPRKQDDGSLQAPGGEWIATSVDKVRLLSTLAQLLRDEGHLEPTIQFLPFMECIAAGDRPETQDFFDKVWVYIVALTIQVW